MTTVEDIKIINRLLKHMNFGHPKHWITKHIPEFESKVIAKAEKTKPPFVAYRKKVMELTESVKHLIPEIEKRGFKSHHIDHKISIWHGFKNNIPAEEIAHIDNLRMLPHKENMLKGRKCA